MTRTQVNRVVIVGRDAAAWLTAVSLHRALGPTGVEVSVVELPSALAHADVYTATPALDGLHTLLGLSEADVLRVCRGVPVLGQRFSGWSGPGTAFVHGYDVKRPAIDDIDFLQFWIKGRAQGLRVPLEDFSIAAAAARQARLTSPGADRGAHGTVVPGYHLHAPAYAGALRSLALSGGVHHVPAERVSAGRDGERITGLQLGGGVQVAGDLYIDASGSDAVLTGGRPWQDWRAWLPCDSTVTLSGPALRPLPGFSEIGAFAAGWIGLFPLQDRTAVTGSWSSAHRSAAEVVEEITRSTQMRFDAAPVYRPLHAGMRTPWVGNCVAIGDAACTLDGLDAVHLLGTQVGISNLIELFPASADAMPEANAYNATLQRHFVNIRDFQAAHYHLNARHGEAFWDAARAVASPPTLAGKIELFAARGQVPLYDDEIFLEQNWAAILVGHGVIPRDYDPRVDAVPAAEQREKFQALLHLIARDVNAMPTVEQYLSGSPARPPATVRAL